MKCYFIGHRDSVGIDGLIYAEIKKLIDSGVTEFYSSGMDVFNRKCELAVKCYDGKLIYVPYSMNQVDDFDRSWYDNIFCPFEEKEYSKSAIIARNKWLAENCDILLCYIYKDGDKKDIVDYAIKKNKKIINLYKKFISFK